MNVHVKQEVELLGHYGGDIAHAMSAWTSTSRELTHEKKERIHKLLKQLADAGHHTPFEKSALHFLIRTDKATHIQLLKHRIGVSTNTESARYKELKDDHVYLPSDFVGLGDLSERVMGNIRQSHELYHELVSTLAGSSNDRRRAKEVARLILPHASMVRCDVMFNFRSFMHFLALRHKADAQKEIQELASDMLTAVRRTGAFDQSLAAFGY